MPARAKPARKQAVKRKIQEIEEPKKVYKSPYERDVDQLLSAVKTAGTRGFPFPGNASNLQMMELCAAPALFDCMEDRTEMQNQMVRLIDEGLNDMDRRMKDELVTMNTRLAEADTILAELNTIRDTAQKTSEDAATTLTELQNKQADKTEAKTAASDAWKVAGHELKVREKNQDAEQSVLDALVHAYDTVFIGLTVIPEPPAAPAEGEEAPVAEAPIVVEEVVEKPKGRRNSANGKKGRRNSAPKEPTTKDKIDIILKQMKLYGCDDSLLNALPFALETALLDSFGDFGRLTLEQCTKWFTEKRMWAEGNLNTAKNSVNEQQTIVNNLWIQLEAAVVELNAAKEAVTAASEALKAANKDLKTKAQDILDHDQKNVDTRKRVADMGLWMAEMDMVLKSFAMLRERKHPPAPEPIEPPVEEVQAMEISEPAPAPEAMEIA